LIQRRIFERESLKMIKNFLNSIRFSRLRMQTILFDLDWKLIFAVNKINFCKFIMKILLLFFRASRV
jgi:hypothetical protein